MSDVNPYVFAKRDSEVKNEKLKTGDTCWIIKDYTILGDEQFYFEWHLIEDVHNLRKMSKVERTCSRTLSGRPLATTGPRFLVITGRSSWILPN